MTRDQLKARRRGRTKAARRALWKSQSGQCFYCGVICHFAGWPKRGREHLVFTVDHHIPRSRGGADHPDNYVGACAGCNAAKADMVPQEFERTLSALDREGGGE